MHLPRPRKNSRTPKIVPASPPANLQRVHADRDPFDGSDTMLSVWQDDDRDAAVIDEVIFTLRITGDQVTTKRVRMPHLVREPLEQHGTGVIAIREPTAIVK